MYVRIIVFNYYIVYCIKVQCVMCIDIIILKLLLENYLNNMMKKGSD